MAVVVDDVDRAGVYARSPQGRRVQPAATNRHSHTSTRRWCIGGLAVKQDAYDRSRDFPARITEGAKARARGRNLHIEGESRMDWRPRVGARRSLAFLCPTGVRIQDGLPRGVLTVSEARVY